MQADFNTGSLHSTRLLKLEGVLRLPPFCLSGTTASSLRHSTGFTQPTAISAIFFMTVVLPLAPWTACTRSLTPQATASSAVRPAGAVGPRAAVIPTASVRNRVAVRPGCAATMAQKKKAEKSAKKLKAAARKRSRRAEEMPGLPRQLARRLPGAHRGAPRVHPQ